MTTPEPVPRPRVVSSRTVYENRWLRLREDAIELPGGAASTYSVLEMSPFALVVPFDGERFHLVGQWRHPLGRFSWEFPQGRILGRPDAPLDEVAHTELAEETGLRARSLERLGRLDVAAGVSDQQLVAFLATGLTAGTARPEPSELGMRTRALTRAELEAELRDGRISDQATVAAYGLLLLRRPVT
jgi:8-oxo-dGDP phosphatase